MTDDIQGYIKKMREAGKSEDEIKIELVKAGWKEKDIPIQSQQQPTPQPDNQKSSSKTFKSLMVVFTVIGSFFILFLGFAGNFEIDAGSNSNNEGTKFYYILPIFIIVSVLVTVSVNRYYFKKNK